MRSIGGALAAAVLALLLCAAQVLPLLEAIPHSAEYRQRTQALVRGGGGQSVALPEAVSRLLPDLLPFAHGIYGKSPVQESRADGSGMPLGYAGAILFPLAMLAFRRPTASSRERCAFLALLIAGILYGASTPWLMDWTARLPGFALALNYRLVFLAALGLAGLAALGAQALASSRSTRALAVSAGISGILLCLAFVAARGVFRDRGLSNRFLIAALALEVAPLLGLAVAARVGAGASGKGLAAAALFLLVGERGLEMGGTYPTLPASSLSHPLPTLASLPLSSEPCRVVAAGDVLRPNGGALYGLEDVRGYESLVLDRFTDTYPLWSSPQHASFNRVLDLTRPFLSLLNACYAIGSPEEAVPRGWREQARGPEMAIFQNPSALPRAFVPRQLRRVPDAGARIRELSLASDFAATAWLSGAGASDESNGAASLSVRAAGTDLILEAQATGRALVATSIPDWPGWVAEDERGSPLPMETVDHAFVGFWLPPGPHTVRLVYRPSSWTIGLAASGVGILAAAVLATFRRRASD